jgi:hypothetical protein
VARHRKSTTLCRSLEVAVTIERISSRYVIAATREKLRLSNCARADLYSKLRK